MLWALADHFVDEVIELYRSREQAERALRASGRAESPHRRNGPPVHTISRAIGKKLTG